MKNTKELEQEIIGLQQRNAKVEADKAWETSGSRKLLIAVLTYVVVVSFFYFAKLPNPFVNAIVPTMGFLLSTLSIPLFKNLWIRYWYR